MSHKRTHKLRTMRAQAREALTRAPSLSAAARELGVHRSTLHRWLRDNPELATAAGQRSSGEQTASSPRRAAAPTPEAWRERMIRAYDFTPAELELLDLAVRALRTARESERETERLAASREFRALIRQLRLPQEETVGQTTTTAQIRPFRRRA